MGFLQSAAFACFLASCSAAPIESGIDLSDLRGVLANVEEAFLHWLSHNPRPYVKDDPSVFARRMDTFKSNAEFVHAHNAQHPSTILHLNEFADLSFEEFSSIYSGYDPSLRDPHSPNTARLGTFRHANVAAPSSIDWTEKGAVTPIKNQGQCGSCWAFSTTGSIEGINFLETGKLVTLSEQEFVDCDHNGDMGCRGGLMDNAFEYALKNGGIDTENDYRYWGSFPLSFCNRRKQADRHVVDITGFEDVPPNDEAALARAVAKQPVSVAICANRALQLYHSGVFSADCCTALNHGVLLVGYDDDPEGGQYWKVKNSWGPGWGEEGYFRLKKDVGGPGQCGIAMDASYPVKDEHTDPVVPTICDPQLFSFWECPAETRCSCDFNLFGLLCLKYSCDPTDAVACGDGESFCPVEAPTCNFDTERCTGENGLNSALLFSEPATKRCHMKQ